MFVLDFVYRPHRASPQPSADYVRADPFQVTIGHGCVAIALGLIHLRYNLSYSLHLRSFSFEAGNHTNIDIINNMDMPVNTHTNWNPFRFPKLD